MGILLFTLVMIIATYLTIKYRYYELLEKHADNKSLGKIVMVLGLLCVAYISSSIAWPAIAEIIQVKCFGVETMGTVIQYIPEHRKSIVHKHLIVFAGCSRNLVLNREYKKGNQIPVKYFPLSPQFLVILNDENLSMWDQLNLRVSDTNTVNANEPGAGSINYIISCFSICIIIIKLSAIINKRKDMSSDL